MKREMLNYIGGLPDYAMRVFPGLLRKTRCSPEHLDELSFYFPEKWNGEGKQFLSVPGEAPEHAVEGTDRSRREDVTVEVIRYPSRYQPRNPRLREAFRKHERNRDGYLVWWRHKQVSGRRPLVLCVHGLLMAEPGRAERMFRIWKLLKLGLDVALYIQPFHWRRSRGGRQYLVNSNNVPYSIEAFGQNIHDLQSAVLLLKSQGYDRIGLIGASLGGYTLALYSTVSPPVDFLFLVVPLIDLYDFIQPRRGALSPLSGEKADSPVREAIKVVSPLANEPRFDRNRIKVVMHGGDRLCRAGYTREWVRKWSVPNPVEVVGGHWLYFDRRARGNAWYGWLGECGYLS